MQVNIAQPMSMQLKAAASKKKEKRREISFLEYKPNAKKHFSIPSSANRSSQPPRPRPTAEKKGLVPTISAGSRQLPLPSKPPQCPKAVMDYVASLHMLRMNLAVQQAVAERQLQTLAQCFGPEVMRTGMASLPGTLPSQGQGQLPPLRAKPCTSLQTALDVQSSELPSNSISMTPVTDKAPPTPVVGIHKPGDALATPALTLTPLTDFVGPDAIGNIALPTAEDTTGASPALDTAFALSCLDGLATDDFDLFSLPELGTPTEIASDEETTLDASHWTSDADSNTLSPRLFASHAPTPPGAFEPFLSPELASCSKSTHVSLDRSLSFASAVTATMPNSPYFAMMQVDPLGMMLADEYMNV